MFDELSEIHIVLVALYLRGGPRPLVPSRRGWPGVLRRLRMRPVSVAEAANQLRAGGFWVEAGLLEDAKLLRWAEDAAPHALTPLSDRYPQGWLASLGEASPPAVWVRGVPPIGDWVGAVGSREVGPRVAGFAREVGRQVVASGRALVSGGAQGCDTYAAQGALAAGGQVVRVLPAGFRHSPATDAIDLSACAPDEPFSTGTAMERNALIYASATGTAIVHARFRQGGTWHGATDALRRKRSRLWVRRDAASQAHRALAALGAAEFESPVDLDALMAGLPLQSSLFSAA